MFSSGLRLSHKRNRLGTGYAPLEGVHTGQKAANPKMEFLTLIVLFVAAPILLANACHEIGQREKRAAR